MDSYPKPGSLDWIGILFARESNLRTSWSASVIMKLIFSSALRVAIPNVTFVGIISVRSPDFRARTYLSIDQSGRWTGWTPRRTRKRPSTTVMKLISTLHFLIPSLSDLFRIESESEVNALKASAAMAKALKDTEPTYPSLVLGPAPAPITRLKSIFRMQILVKAPTRKDLRQILGGMKTFGYGGSQSGGGYRSNEYALNTSRKATWQKTSFFLMIPTTP